MRECKAPGGGADPNRTTALTQYDERKAQASKDGVWSAEKEKKENGNKSYPGGKGKGKGKGETEKEKKSKKATKAAGEPGGAQRSRAGLAWIKMKIKG